MGLEDTFNGAKRVYGVFGAFFNTIIHEIGLNAALNLLTTMFETRFSTQGKILKDQMGRKLKFYCKEFKSQYNRPCKVKQYKKSE